MVAHIKNRKVRRRMIDERCSVHRDLDITTVMLLYMYVPLTRSLAEILTETFSQSSSSSSVAAWRVAAATRWTEREKA